MTHGELRINSANRVEASVGGRHWLLDREADLETLWDRMDNDALDEDERLPYWAEVWPASLLLGEWLVRNRDMVAGKRCLDVGCGLGLTAMIAADLGARVLAFDYVPEALAYARHNAELNGVPQPLWTVMDWRFPALPQGAFEFIWAGDVLYEKRFFEPLTALFRHALAPGGRIWVGEPVRTVSRPVWDDLEREGFVPRKLTTEKVALCGQEPTVNLWEIRLPEG
ncbi:class I SAM-dependent methyltransferase [Salidesulfovibrio brasiliensis]|uniref:class I SAM-dependent methyltransferase n=1 Tax=Salidesulfovibrio brasiliensis TaxID=221711 RepID=UPI0006D12E53|nr:methyltransferase domain-containing protein [Salidesulfovibrio brasiliensis]